MAHFATTIDTPGSAEAVFEYMADFSNAARWDPSVTSAKRLSRKPIGLGSRFEINLGLGTAELRWEYRVTRYEPNRVLAFEANTRFIRSLDTIEIEDTAEGCRVHYDADLRSSGIAYLFDVPLHLAFQISGARSASGLERALALIPTDRAMSA